MTQAARARGLPPPPAPAAPLRDRRAPVAAVATAYGLIYIIWGSNFLAIRFAVETIPPFLLMSARSLMAGLALLAWGMARDRVIPRPLEWRDAAIVGSLLFFVGHGGLAWSQQFVPSGIAALLMATIPLWMVLLDWQILKTIRPGPRTWSGLALGIAGIALLVRPGRGVDVAPPILPSLILVLASLAWAAGSVASRMSHVRRSVATTTGMQLTCGGLMLGVLAFASGETAQSIAPSARSLLAMAYMVVLASIVTFTAYIWLLRVSSPGRVGSYAFVNPLVAVVMGWAFAGEHIGRQTIVAAAVIVTGVILIVTAPRTRVVVRDATP